MIINIHVSMDLANLESTFSLIILLNSHNSPVLKLRPRDIK